MSYMPPMGAATTTSKGIIKLSGDLSGTADSPVVTGLANKINLSQIDPDASLAANSDSKLASQEAVKAYIDNKAMAGGGGAVTEAGLPAGTMMYSKNGAARPTTRTDILVTFYTATQPTAMLDGDQWVQTA